MHKHARWLATAAILFSCFACGGDDDGDDRASGDDGDGVEGGGGGGGGAPEPRIPTEEEIAAALADAGVFFDDGGVTIGDSRIDYGPDGIRVDDAPIVTLGDGGIMLGEGDSSFTIRTDGTCAELLACCESLTDEMQKTECTTAHNDFMAIPLGAGDFLCGQFLGGFCP